MALLHEAVEQKKYDVRLIERNMARGLISPEEVQKAASSLSDDSENADYVNIEVLAEQEVKPEDRATH